MGKNLLIGLLVLLAGCSARLITLNNVVHYDDDDDYNGNLRGIGIEIPLNETTYLGLTYFTNSHDEQSRLLSLSKENKLYKNLYWGLIAAVADGYDEYAFLGGFQMRYELFKGLSIRGLFTPVLTASGLVWEFN